MLMKKKMAAVGTGIKISTCREPRAAKKNILQAKKNTKKNILLQKRKQKTAVGAIAPETVCRAGGFSQKKCNPWQRIIKKKRAGPKRQFSKKRKIARKARGLACKMLKKCEKKGMKWK